MDKQKIENWYNKNYKKLLIIPLLLIILSLGYIFYFYQTNNDFIYKDISLTGGTSATINGNFNVETIKNDLSKQLGEINVREVYDLITQEKKAIIIETKLNQKQTKSILEGYFGYELNSDNSSFEFTGSTLSENFYRQLLIAVLIAFSFMGWVVFIIFGKKFNFKLITGIVVFLNAILSFWIFDSTTAAISSLFTIFFTLGVYFFSSIPSIAVILSAFADILMTLVLVNILGIQMSTAGIVAILMLVGYSVDTDILLTTRVLRRKEGSINKRILGAFKTGITMTLTSFVTMFIALIIVMSFSVVLSQIFTILLIGLGFDIFNTWITNVSILKWYAEKNEN